MNGHGQKWMRPFRSYGTLKWGPIHIWFDESSILIELFLHADSDSIIFGLATNLLCIFDIWRVSSTVVFIKNDGLLPVPTRKVLELDFSKSFFNKKLD